MGLFPEIKIEATCDTAGQTLLLQPSLTQLLAVVLVYGYVAYAFGEMASDAAEKLAAYTSPRFVTAVVVPFVGAVPDVAITGASVLSAQSDTVVIVGVGALIGSIIFLQTIPVGVAGLISRSRFEEARRRIREGGTAADDSAMSKEAGRAETTRSTRPAGHQSAASAIHDARRRTAAASIAVGDVGARRGAGKQQAVEMVGDTPRHDLPHRTVVALTLIFVTSLGFLAAQIPDFVSAPRSFERVWLLVLGIIGGVVTVVYLWYIVRGAESGSARVETEEGVRVSDHEARLATMLRLSSYDEAAELRHAMGVRGGARCKAAKAAAADARAVPPGRPRWLGAAWYSGLLVLYLTIVALVSEPFVNSLDAIARELRIHPFYIAYVVAPLVSNIGEVLVASAQAHTAFVIAADQLFTGVVLENVFVAPAFFVILYLRGVDWVYPTESIVIVSMQVVLAVYFLKSFSVNRVAGPPKWHSWVMIAAFPLSVVYVWLLDRIAGLAELSWQ